MFERRLHAALVFFFWGRPATKPTDANLFAVVCFMGAGKLVVVLAL
jgi:hypothetical protein